MSKKLSIQVLKSLVVPYINAMKKGDIVASQNIINQVSEAQQALFMSFVSMPSVTEFNPNGDKIFGVNLSGGAYNKRAYIPYDMIKPTIAALQEYIK
jgi:hypothetical protein